MSTPEAERRLWPSIGYVRAGMKRLLRTVTVCDGSEPVMRLKQWRGLQSVCTVKPKARALPKKKTGNPRVKIVSC